MDDWTLLYSIKFNIIVTGKKLFMSWLNMIYERLREKWQKSIRDKKKRKTKVHIYTSNK